MYFVWLDLHAYTKIWVGCWKYLTSMMNHEFCFLTIVRKVKECLRGEGGRGTLWEMRVNLILIQPLLINSHLLRILDLCRIYTMVRRAELKFVGGGEIQGGETHRFLFSNYNSKRE